MKEFEPNENIVHFLQWIKDRHEVFENKSAGKPFPWTDNEIITNHKFTNVFRILDFESQYLINHVIGKDDRDIVDTTFRILFFKLFNYKPTWEFLESRLGDITYRENIIEDTKEALDEYVVNNKVFSSAYLQASNFVQQPRWDYLRGTGKHNQYLGMLKETLLTDNGLVTLINMANSPNLSDVVNYIQTTPGYGQFMALQMAQDLNYSHWFKQDINVRTWEGPGSIRGVKRCFDNIDKRDYADAIKWTWEHLEELFEEYGLGEPPNFKKLQISLQDTQNCFCENDKYQRGLGIVVDGVAGKSIKQKYRPSNARIVTEYSLPKFLR